MHGKIHLSVNAILRVSRRVSLDCHYALSLIVRNHPNTNMPSHPKRRAPSRRVYTSAPNDRQVHFPSRGRSINPTKPTPPASRTRQQTLTQIDFVTKYLPQDDDLDLDYIEKEASPKRKRRTTLPSKDAVKEDGSSKRKGRKTLPAQCTESALEEDRSPEKRRRRTLPVNHTPSIVETRTSRRRKVKQEPESVQNATSTTTGKQSNATHTQAGPARSELIPPRTPATARKVEIPSSQSPGDTPLSTQRTSSMRSPVRSPLKARSTNVRVPLIAGLKIGKLTGWHPKLEVKSSVSWENEDSQPLTASPYLRTVGNIVCDFGRSDNLNGLNSRQEEEEKTNGAVQGPIRTAEPFNRPTPTPQYDQSSKTEIRDSDDEDSDEEGEEVSSLHNLRNTTQPIEHVPQLPQSFQPTTNGPSPRKATPTSITDKPFLSPLTERSVPAQTPSSKCELGHKIKDVNTLTNGNTPSPIHPLYPPLSSAEAAAAQLSSDLYRQTQPRPHSQHEENTEGPDHPPTPTSRLLDSQSQFGFICRDYTPSSPPLPPIATALPVSKERNIGPEHSQNSRSRSPSPSPSTSNHPRTPRISTQSPCSTRTVHQTTFPGPPPKQPHSPPSQIFTQSQSPLKNPDHSPLPALQSRPQLSPSFESRSSLQVVDAEFTLHTLPRHGADVEEEEEHEHEHELGRSPPSFTDVDADTGADLFPPQPFIQSSPLLAPSLPSSPLLSRINLQYDNHGEDEDEDEEESHATAEVGVAGGGNGWDGRFKRASRLLPERMLEDESQDFGLGLPPAFSSQWLEQD